MTLVALVSGLLLSGGVLGVVAGVRRVPVVTGVPSRRRIRTRLARVPRYQLFAAPIAFAAGVVVALVSGWVVAMAAFPLAAVGLPAVLGRSMERRTIIKLEGLAEWTRALAGVITVGVGLEGALVATVRSAPDTIRPEVSRLVTRVRSHWPMREALTAFADDLDDITADRIAATLMLAATKRADGLAHILGGLAESVSAEVSARRRLEADRDKPRQTARLATVITAATLVVLAATGTYLEPYRSPFGQVLLGMLLAVYAVALVMMRRMAAVKPLPRFLTRREARS